jgi:endonuclease/exonuclease/phosphatase family metal-dependent hydrolase
MAAPPLARVPKATPLSSADGDASRLSVLSYNVLAPLYVRPIDTRTGGVQAFAAFEWCGEGDELLDFAVRCPRMLAEINAAAADAVMLQEVQFEPTEAGDGFALPAWLRPLTVEGGGDYVARIPAQADLKEIAERNERVLNCLAPVGNALLLKQQRLEVLEVQATVAPGARSATKGATTRVGALVRGAEGSALRDVLAPTMVFSVHLDATHEDQRVATLVKCLQQARQLGTREVLIAGDMNTEILRGSCVEALIAAAADEPGAGEGAAEAAAAAAAEEEEEEEEDEASLTKECASALRLGEERLPSAEEMQSWKELRASAAAAPRDTRIELRRVPTHGTRAAYDHGQTVGPCRSWRLDHILYSARTLQPAVVWETLEADPESTAAGLPNSSCPSDHLPVAASFEVRPAPVLGESEREALRSSWAARQRAQALEVTALEEVLQGEEASLVASLPPAAADGDAAAAGAAAGAAAAGGGAAAEASEPAAPPQQQQQAAKKSKKDQKKKKKVKNKPSAEMISFLRSKRERLKSLKAAHAAATAEAVAQLAELEVDALEDMGLLH